MNLHYTNNIVGRGISHIRERGLVSFTKKAVKTALPDPYGDRVTNRGKLARKHLQNGFSSSLSFSDRLHAFRRGHTEELYRLYSFDEGIDETYYLSEYHRRLARKINLDPMVLDDKRRFQEYMTEHGFDSYLPDTFGQIENNQLVSDRYDSVDSLLKDKTRVVIKGKRGGGGEHVYICEDRDGSPILSGRVESEIDLHSKLGELNGHLVTEYCDQANYVENIYPDAANTIRVLVIDPNGDDAFIADAVHRIGTCKSGILDNFSQRGLSVEIDCETGELGKAVERLDDQQLRYHDTHPDTNAQIAGVLVPGWKEIKSELLQLTSDLPGVRYVGWDIVVTNLGEFKIIEGNSHPNPRVLQVHQPLLTKPAIRKFYNNAGIYPC